MLKNFFQNACKPQGLGGRIILNKMNAGHAPMAKWGISHIAFKSNDDILDIGCGGGANLTQFLKICKNGTVTGVDYSTVSVKKSSKKNRKAIKEGRCKVLQGNVSMLPFADDAFDIITAFETIYFWPRIANSFAEVYRVLKAGGVFMICNEIDGSSKDDEKWSDMINGMTIYNKEQLEALLKDAGFSKTEIFSEGKHWLCVVAYK